MDDFKILGITTKIFQIALAPNVGEEREQTFSNIYGGGLCSTIQEDGHW
jgi:hypothetical protein